MSKKSPLHRVREEFGSKEKLAAKVIEILDRPEDEEAEEFEHRVNTMSNRKLLRLYEANQTLSSKYDSREDLVEKIVRARFPGGNEDYLNKIGGYSVPRLLDLARQHRV